MKYSKNLYTTTIYLLVSIIIFFTIFTLMSRPSIVSAELSSEPEKLDKVTLQLKWRHQFQFAGYYAAVEKGFYSQAGLDVKIFQSMDEDPSKKVLEGKADFGIAMSDLILLRNKGHKIVALAAIYQHSPLVLLVPKKTGINNVHALSNKRVMIEPHSAELFAYLEYERMNPSKMIIYPHSYHTEDLVNGKVDAMSAYSTDEPFMLKKNNIDYNIFSPRSGGIDFYGDTLYTLESQIQEHPKRVDAFLQASLKGWQYALNNSEEIIDLILSKYSKRHSREHLLFESQKTKQLIMPNVVEIGYMNPGRWRYIAEVYKSMNMIPQNFSLEDFLYEKNTNHEQKWIIISIISAFLVVLFAFLITAYFVRLNIKLKKEIKKRKVSDDRLLESERALTTLMQNLPGMAYRCENNIKWTMLFVSAGCFDLTGYKSSELCNDSKIIYGDLIHPEDQQMVWQTVQSALKEKKAFELTYRIIDKSGNQKWVREQGLGVFKETGEIIALEGLITDITEYKCTLEKLEQAKKAAEIANQAKNTFLANMSHEIRSPISGIIGMSKMIINISSEKEVQDNLKSVLDTAKSLSNIINDILDLSKIEDKKLKMLSIDFNLSETLNQLMGIFSYAIENKGLDFKLLIHPDVPQNLNGDPNRLIQVLRNLLSNAIKFTDEGMIQIKVVEIKNGKNLKLQFTVSDTGIGIPKNKIADIFEKFTQIDTTYSKKYAGTGLGLSISKELVELMGGNIWVESTEGKGTDFFFNVYFKKAEIVQKKIDSKPINLRPKSSKALFKKILIAEDDRLNQKSITYFLKKEGFEIFIAENGIQVLELLKKFSFDLILMDIQMPVMDGLEATKRIRNSTTDEFDTDIPIIALTAYAMKGDREKMIASGMTDYIAKPVRMNDLVSKIKAIMVNQ
ncbi:multi-sensor hybrid histidine kinase [Candidatus Magnetomorum sp. HK-1]|nr:multi-sensor hybrid histidine kinase [Candidatus Magnetomorum sp. HK-1]